MRVRVFAVKACWSKLISYKRQLHQKYGEICAFSCARLFLKRGLESGRGHCRVYSPVQVSRDGLGSSFDFESPAGRALPCTRLALKSVCGEKPLQKLTRSELPPPAADLPPPDPSFCACARHRMSGATGI